MKHALLHTCFWFLLQAVRPLNGLHEYGKPSTTNAFVPEDVTNRGGFMTEKNDCGISNADGEANIAGVVTAEGDRFPYLCSLKRNGNEGHVCDGVLIDQKWILTSAHCLWNQEGTELGHDALVRCGLHRNNAHEAETWMQSKQAYWPSEWDGNFEHGFDVGLLRLDRRAPLTKTQIDEISDAWQDQALSAAGWSGTDEYKTDREMQLDENLTVLPSSICEKEFDIELKDHMVCVNSASAEYCQESSGRPLLILDKPKGHLSQGKPQHDVLVGVRSLITNNCGLIPFAVYTRMSAFRDWIEATIKRETPEFESLEDGRREDFVDPHEILEEIPQQEMPGVFENDKKWRKDTQLLDAWTAEHDAVAIIGHKQKTIVPLDLQENAMFLSNDGSTPLHAAARAGDLQLVKSLIARGIDIDEEDDDDWTPLHMATRYGHTEVVRVLVEHGAQIDPEEEEDWTPLHMAARYGYTEIAEILLDHGADVEAEEEDDWTPLHMAASYGHTKIVKALLEHGADVNAEEEDNWTPLHMAARYGHTKSVRLLIKYGADVNAVEEDGWTPLHMASTFGYTAIAKALLNNGARPNVVGQDGWRPLHMAARYGHTEIVQALLDHGADANVAKKDQWTPLHQATELNYTEIVEALLDHGADPNVAKDDGWTPLHQATHYQYTEIVANLLDHGADANFPKVDGETPLHEATRAQNADIVLELLEHGADANVPRIDGEMPLHAATRAADTDIVTALLEYGADPNAPTVDGQMPLHQALVQNNTEIVIALLVYEADANVVMADGATPLHRATKDGNADTVQALLDYGGDVNGVDKDNWTALHVAASYGRLEIAQALVSAGASKEEKTQRGEVPLDLICNRARPVCSESVRSNLTELLTP